MKPDDSSLTPEQYATIRKHASWALESVGGFGRFPTPVAEVMAEARVAVVDDDVLDESFLVRIRRKATGALKSALSKVLGVLDVIARVAYVDRSVLRVKQTFLKLHETAHAVLPHQAKLYGLVEDCAMTIAPDVSELFDREANVFAAEVLFQVDRFIEEARDQAFAITVPIKLGRKYGASVYASIRQYVSKHPRPCCVLVIDPPELVENDGFRAKLRRVVTSTEFDREMGTVRWPTTFTPGDAVGAFIPTGKRRMSRPRSLVLLDQHGDRRECLAEAFASGHQVFVLIHSVRTLMQSSVVVG